MAYGSDANESLLSAIASDPESSHAFSGGEVDIGNIFGQIGRIIGGEKTFFHGSLRQLLTELESGQGIPLDDNRETLFDEFEDDPASESREDFVNPTNNLIGLGGGCRDRSETPFRGIPYRSTSVYTEQSRHNDGADSISSPT